MPSTAPACRRDGGFGESAGHRRSVPRVSSGGESRRRCGAWRRGADDGCFRRRGCHRAHVGLGELVGGGGSIALGRPLPFGRPVGGGQAGQAALAPGAGDLGDRRPGGLGGQGRLGHGRDLFGSLGPHAPGTQAVAAGAPEAGRAGGAGPRRDGDGRLRCLAPCVRHGRRRGRCGQRRRPAGVTGSRAGADPTGHNRGDRGRLAEDPLESTIGGSGELVGLDGASSGGGGGRRARRPARPPAPPR